MRRRRRSRSLAAQSVALGLAVPQVIAHRMARMGDHKEMHRMGAEKFLAAGEAWNAMAAQAIIENQKLALSMMTAYNPLMQSFWSPWTRVLAKGMAPISRRAVANARRLGARKPRKRIR